MWVQVVVMCNDAVLKNIWTFKIIRVSFNASGDITLRADRKGRIQSVLWLVFFTHGLPVNILQCTPNQHSQCWKRPFQLLNIYVWFVLNLFFRCFKHSYYNQSILGQFIQSKTITTLSHQQNTRKNIEHISWENLLVFMSKNM